MSFRKFKRKIKRMPTEDKMLIGFATIIVIMFIFFGIARFGTNAAEILTIDDMHEKNFKGKLNPEQGYLYNGFSFVNFTGIWYTQLAAGGGSIYDIAFNYDPKQVEHIPVEGGLSGGFLERDTFHITFDPTDDGLKYVAQTNAGLSTSLVKAFGKYLVAGCLVNETVACASREPITCDDEDKSVIVLLNENETKVTLDDNCVIIQGKDEDLVKAKDRLLLRWYGIHE